MCLLTCTLSRLRIKSAFSYWTYLSLKIIFARDFCVLSRSSTLSCVSELCQSTQDCSSTLLQKKIPRCTFSSFEAPKLYVYTPDKLHSVVYFLYQLATVLIPREGIINDCVNILIWFTTSIFSPFSCSLEVNWWLFVRLKNIAFVFFCEMIIFCFSVHSLMLLRYSCDFKCLLSTNWPCRDIWCYLLPEVKWRQPNS